MTEVNLKALRRGALEVLGAAKGIPGYGDLTKDELVAALAGKVTIEELVNSITEKPRSFDALNGKGITTDAHIPAETNPEPEAPAEKASSGRRWRR